MKRLPSGHPSVPSAWQWVKLARADDERRPILAGVYYSGSENGSVLVATDGHRLHVAPHRPGYKLPQGVYRVDDLAGLDGKYPNYEQVLTPMEDVLRRGWAISRGDLLARALRGVVAFWKATRTAWYQGGVVMVPVSGQPDQVAYVQPVFLQAALAGLGEGTRLWLPGPLQPLQLADAAGRRAAIMPVRMSPFELPPSTDDTEALLVVQNADGLHLNSPSLRVPLLPYLVAPSGD